MKVCDRCRRPTQTLAFGAFNLHYKGVEHALLSQYDVCTDCYTAVRMFLAQDKNEVVVHLTPAMTVPVFDKRPWWRRWPWSNRFIQADSVRQVAILPKEGPYR